MLTCPFDVGDNFSDSRTNPFEKGEDDKNHCELNICAVEVGKLTCPFDVGDNFSDLSPLEEGEDDKNH